MPSQESWRRLQEAIVGIQRITNSRKIDILRAERSGVPLSLVTTGVLRPVVEAGPLRAAELAERARMQPAALSRQLAILEREGCIERVRDPADRRASLVRSTARGRAVHRRVRVAAEELFAAQLASWSGDELDNLSGLLERLIADLRAPPVVPEPPSPMKTQRRR